MTKKQRASTPCPPAAEPLSSLTIWKDMKTDTQTSERRELASPAAPAPRRVDVKPDASHARGNEGLSPAGKLRRGGSCWDAWRRPVPVSVLGTHFKLTVSNALPPRKTQQQHKPTAAGKGETRPPCCPGGGRGRPLRRPLSRSLPILTEDVSY